MASVEPAELKKTIATLLRAGNSLSEVQTLLRRDHGVNMTFLELRLLASEIKDLDWSKGEAAEKPEKKRAAAEAEDDEEAITPEALGGGTVVELSQVARPGAALSGSVKFSSGVTADWVLDAYGRLALENASGQPTRADLEDFQAELQRKLGAGAG
jgi:hypothetical protein